MRTALRTGHCAPAHDGGQVVQVPVQALRVLTRADFCLPGGLGWGRESKTARACTRRLSSRMGCSFCAPRQGRGVRDGWECENVFTLLSVGACTRWLGWRSNIGEIFRWSRACVMSSRWTPPTGSWACTRGETAARVAKSCTCNSQARTRGETVHVDGLSKLNSSSGCGRWGQTRLDTGLLQRSRSWVWEETVAVTTRSRARWAPR